MTRRGNSPMNFRGIRGRFRRLAGPFNRLDQFGAGAHRYGESLFRWRAASFAQTELVQFEMMHLGKTRLRQRVPRAVQRATIHGDDVFRLLRFEQQWFDTPANAGEAGHFTQFLSRQCSCRAVGQFAGVGAA